MKKGCIVDVIKPGVASVKMDDGTFCEAVKEKNLQTALPKVGGTIILLRGEHKSKKGELLERDSNKNRGAVKLFKEYEPILCVLDDIAEYVDSF